MDKGAELRDCLKYPENPILYVSAGRQSMCFICRFLTKFKRKRRAAPIQFLGMTIRLSFVVPTLQR